MAGPRCHCGCQTNPSPNGGDSTKIQKKKFMLQLARVIHLREMANYWLGVGN